MGEKKNFKFTKFSFYQPQSTQIFELNVPEYLREEIRQTTNNHLLEIGKELREQNAHAAE